MTGDAGEGFAYISFAYAPHVSKEEKEKNNNKKKMRWEKRSEKT